MDKIASDSINRVVARDPISFGAPNPNAPDPIDYAIDLLIEDIKKGLLVPVLGGDINLCGRPAGNDTTTTWQELNYAPTTWELALHLLKEAGRQNLFEDEQDIRQLADVLVTQLGSPQDSMSPICLANVCQYLKVINTNMVDALVPALLSKKYEPTPVHKFVVKLAQYKADSAKADTPYPCIVTTCFDQVLEQQLRANNVPFHLVAFVLGDSGGVFQYTAPGKDPGDAAEITEQNVSSFMGGLKKDPVIIKLNGGTQESRDFPITEDHYIDYLGHQGIKDSLPEILLAKLTKRGTRSSRLLFLGYSPRHWNLRVILRRIWSESLTNMNKRWTVVMERRFSKIDKKFWLECGVQERELTQIDSLESYITKLLDRMDNLPPPPTLPPGSPPALVPPSPASVRDGIFISYSHEDKFWRKELVKMLVPLGVKVWDDTKIDPGDKWKEEIEKALASAKAAVFLVTPDFLSSDFIASNELPPLLEAAQNKGCRILWIKVKASVVENTSIGQYQALYNGEPLDSLIPTEQNSALVKIATKIWTITNAGSKSDA
jgi:TIR domain/SIR2-like domain